MPRPLTDILSDLPAKRRTRVDARYRELKQQVEGLAELRRLAGRMQVEIAEAMEIRQPSVSKIETQSDMLLSTLRSYVEAIGGELQLVVKLPDRQPFELLPSGPAATTTASRAKPRAGEPRRRSLAKVKAPQRPCRSR
jgi:predicted XRE-type DNA-binding protein